MSDEKVIERVITKLTDLRLSLETEERYVLDKMIVGEKAEVTGHRYEIGWDGRVALEGEEYKVIP